MNPLDLLSQLTAPSGAPGHEREVRDVLARLVDGLGLVPSTDAKGNLLVCLGQEEKPRIVVTAHLDEIAMLVRQVCADGSLAVGPLGGIYPWKLGEGMVRVQSEPAAIDGVLSFGSMHSKHVDSAVPRVEAGRIGWDEWRVTTGQSPEDLERVGVRVGTRVVVHPSRRTIHAVGDSVAGYFLDDRALLVVWLLLLEELKDSGLDVLFAATVSEEVGGEGAIYLVHDLRPETCVALEISPDVPDAPVELCSRPSVWVQDSYATMSHDDLDLVHEVAKAEGLRLQYQSLSRAGSDATCAAAKGLCAKHFTLGVPCQNSHGFEIMHKDAMQELTRLTSALLRRL